MSNPIAIASLCVDGRNESNVRREVHAGCAITTHSHRMIPSSDEVHGLKDSKPLVASEGAVTENPGEMNLETDRFGVAGMTCDKCAQRVESALRKVDGVREVKVDRHAALANVTFEREKTNIAALHDAVLKAGYKPSALPQR